MPTTVGIYLGDFSAQDPFYPTLLGEYDGDVTDWKSVWEHMEKLEFRDKPVVETAVLHYHEEANKFLFLGIGVMPDPSNGYKEYIEYLIHGGAKFGGEEPESLDKRSSASESMRGLEVSETDAEHSIAIERVDDNRASESDEDTCRRAKCSVM